MDVTPLVRSDLRVVQSYKDGAFRISGQVYETSVFIFADRVLDWSFSGSFADISVDDFAPLFDYADTIDVVLLGTGTQMQFFRPDLRNALKEKGLSVDAMDTGAACRTYNVLAAEGRRVVAALLPF